MEVSWLLTDEIDIEIERRQLQQSGMSWVEIKGTLVSKYRESSKKGLFRCKCCNSITHIVLNENKACHFKHKSMEECAGSRNYKRYISKTTEFENTTKHLAGKAIIKDQLSSNLSLKGAKVIDGYLYRVELNLVPDIIVEWPNGDVWSFDYVTGTRTEQYQRYLLKKQETYIQNNFKSYFFFDHAQITYKHEQNALALSHAEKGSLRFLSNNHPWEALLQDLADTLGEESLIPDSRLKLKDMKVYQILYLTDDIQGILYKLSQLQLRPHVKIPEIPDRWYMIVGNEKRLSLNNLFAYNADLHGLSWESAEVSSEELNDVVIKAENRYQDLLRAKEEEKRKLLEEQERQEQKKRERKSVQEDISEGWQRPNSHTHYGQGVSRLTVKKQSLEENVEEYRFVLDLMRNSSLLQSSPGFIDRIKDCEEDIHTYETTGELPKRIFGYIQMMKNALNI